MDQFHITEKAYYRLISGCDRLLRRPDTALEVFANSKFHIVNEVPFVISPHADFIETMTSNAAPGTMRVRIRKISGRYRNGAYRLAKVFRNLTRSVACAGAEALPYPALTKALKKIDVIIVSWLINPDHLSDKDDFYFGAIQSILADMGYSSLLLLRNQSGHPTPRILPQAGRQEPFPRIMLPDLVSFRQEFDFLFRCIAIRRKLHKIAGHEESRFDAKLYRSAADYMISAGVIENLRLHGLVEAICRELNPKAILTLYEGHAWERCAWHAARSACPRCLCAGYQHTAFRKHSHAVKRSMLPNGDYDPNLLLTLGGVTDEILVQSEIGNKTKTLIYGTHRRTGADNAIDRPSRKSAFLVLPEGDEFECIYLYELAMECAERLPDVEFIFRTHPYYPIERLESRQTWQFRKFENVIISKEPDIEEDYAHAGNLLYRGSSTVIYAILFGLKPFYFKRPGEMNFDPLFGLSEWRENVSSVDDLIQRHRKDNGLGESERYQSWKAARRYCDNYVQPIRKSSIQSMMDIAESKQLPNSIHENR